MTRPLSLAVQSMAYAVAVVALISSFCAFEVFQCRVNTDVSLSEAAIPVSLVAVALLIVGAIVAVINAWVLSHLSKNGRDPSSVVVIVTGMFAGVLPRLVYEFSSEPQLFFHFEYVPFLFGGLVVAVLASWLRRPRAV